MFKLILCVIVFSLVVGCSNTCLVDSNLTVGTTDNVVVDCTENSITLHQFNSVVTYGELYFYLNFEYSHERIVQIPNGSIFVDGYAFDNISAFISQDAAGRWYMQFIRNDSNLSMSIGADIEIKSFTVRW